MAGVRQASYSIATFNLGNETGMQQSFSQLRQAQLSTLVHRRRARTDVDLSLGDQQPPSRQACTIAGGGAGLRRAPGSPPATAPSTTPTRGQITRHSSTDSTIESHTMGHVATNGIDITGARITVHATPSGAGDDRGLRLVDNR